MDWSPQHVPLAQVQATLRLLQSDAGDISHVVALMTQYLDHRSLEFAAKIGDVPMFQFFVTRVLADLTLHETERAYQFARAMKAAIKNDDLPMVEAVHNVHPEPLVVWSLKTAMKHSSLEMVQWVILHRQDRMCCRPGITVCDKCLKKALEHLGRRDALRVLTWLLSVGRLTLAELSALAGDCLFRVLPFSGELTKWLHDMGYLRQATAEKVLEAALSHATPYNLETIRCLVENGYKLPEDTLIRVLIRASLQENSDAVMEYVVGSRLCYLFRHQFDYRAARRGGTKFVQVKPRFLTEEHRDIYRRYCEGVRWLCEQSPSSHIRVAGVTEKREDKLLELFVWLEARGLGSWSSEVMDVAAGCGFLRVVQWLHLNRTEGCTKAAMTNAAVNGHLHVVQWLHANRVEGCTNHAMVGAAENNHLPVVRWLRVNRATVSTRSILAAATAGHLRVVVWLHRNRVVRPGAYRRDGCVTCLLHYLFKYPYAGNTKGDSKRTTDRNVISWLESQLTEDDCTQNCGELWPGASPTLFQTAVRDAQLLDFLLSPDRDATFARVRVQRDGRQAAY